jgi:methylated-DNA-protein-cysteine methyltransferase related protein
MFNPPNPKLFNALVWEIVRQIPSGKVATYGQIASMIPPPEGVEPPDFDRLGPRWVGNAMNAVSGPHEVSIPWQRVINAKGTISLPEGSTAAAIQRQRLEAEGVQFDDKGKVNFEVVGWDGPDKAWLKEKDLFPPRSLKKKKSDDKGQMNLF